LDLSINRNPTPPIPDGLFQWIPATIRLSEEFMLTHTGLDTVMHLRFLRTAAHLMAISLLVIGGILLPLNHRYETQTDELRLESFSMMPIAEKEPVLYIHMLLTHVLTALTIWLFYRDLKAFVKLRRDFLLRRARDGLICSRSVMVTELPKELRSDEKLREYFTSLGIGQVESAMVLRHSGKLSRKLARREQQLAELEELHIELAKNVMYAVKQHRAKQRSNRDQEKENASDEADLNGEPSTMTQLESGATHLEEATHRKTPTRRRKRDYIKFLLKFVAHICGKRTAQPSSSAMYQASRSLFNNMGASRSSNPLLQDLNSSDLDSGDGEFNIWRILSSLPRRALDPFQPIRIVMKSHQAREYPAIDYHLRKFNKQDRRVAELRASYMRIAKPTTTGFVTFVHPASAQLCAQSIISADKGSCKINMAPEPRDIIWQNHKVNRHARRARRTTINIAVWSLTIFWFFIMSGILFVTSYDGLAKAINGVQPGLEVTFLDYLIKNVLPPAIIALFMSILPFVLHSKWQRWWNNTISCMECLTGYRHGVEQRFRKRLNRCRRIRPLRQSRYAVTLFLLYLMR
jgi:hypothetical protein